MIARYILYTLAWLVATIIGIFGGYHLARYLGIGEGIWGNSVDGYCGDDYYQINQGQAWYRKYWACWWWSCIRNPANNLLRHKLNAEGIISKIEKHGNLTLVTFKNGKRAFFYYYKGRFHSVKLGWKLWGNEIKVSEYYDASFVFKP